MTSKPNWWHIPDLTADAYTGAIPQPQQFKRVPAHTVKADDWVRFDHTPYRVMSAKLLQKRYVVLHTARVEGGAFVDFTVMQYQNVETWRQS